ncbi:MAG: hypothetical protein BJ554DRAFT_3158 [Olpidium bornovanus]|uniref:F-box domain-containing protein n=1 Tax=Olpidium bornovanus TaxID=278681 RepID=A0A8H8DG26_9FUNG|nr:MAG: hypothetical protein BJ554DRAFT_3158 [Olpidium bornovanus]
MDGAARRPSLGENVFCAPSLATAPQEAGTTPARGSTAAQQGMPAPAAKAPDPRPGRNPFDLVPAEIVQMIIDALPLPSVLDLTHVCGRFRRAAVSGSRFRHIAVAGWRERLGGARAAALFNHAVPSCGRAVRSVDMACVAGAADECAASVARWCHNLTSLSVSSAQAVGAAAVAKILESNPGLARIEAADYDHLDDDLVSLISRRCPRLQYLDVSVSWTTCSYSGASLAGLFGRCKFLNEVHLVRCLCLTDDVLMVLAENCRRMKVVNIQGCTKVISTVAAGMEKGAILKVGVCSVSWSKSLLDELVMTYIVPCATFSSLNLDAVQTLAFAGWDKESRQPLRTIRKVVFGAGVALFRWLCHSGPSNTNASQPDSDLISLFFRSPKRSRMLEGSAEVSYPTACAKEIMHSSLR